MMSQKIMMMWMLLSNIKPILLDETLCCGSRSWNPMTISISWVKARATTKILRFLIDQSQEKVGAVTATVTGEEVTPKQMA